jgi:hypothetical protein
MAARVAAAKGKIDVTGFAATVVLAIGIPALLFTLWPG